jgi:hypothetical protein
VKFHTTSAKILRHPAVGEFELTGEALTLPGDHGLTIITYTVEPHSASEQALNFLASWSAQASPCEPARVRDQRGDEVTREQRRLGSTGVWVSELCLGTMMFGQWAPRTTARGFGSSTARSTPASPSPILRSEVL